ncbi:MAG: glycosyltransferase family 4 protein [Candidatus Liptonbacteria bacterium]|nr:glycosyltransferase family 4 protein [Candidatus Liptonbacteria bacterium]
MKILYITSDTNSLGGIQQYNRKFIAALKARGDSVVLVEIKSGGAWAGIKFVLNSFFKSVSFKPDVIVCAHVNYSPIGFFIKKLFGYEYIVCTHGIDVWNIRSFLQRKSLLEAKVITTVAEFTGEKMIAQLPELKDKIYFLYNPVDGSRFAPKGKPTLLINRYGLKGKKVIFTVARLSSLEGYKGYDRVIQAMPEILSAVTEAIYLLGGKGDDMPRVRNLIDAMNLGDKVIVAGFIPDEEIVDYYNLADVFTMPSKAEGAPAVYVEALSCGIPVIAGNQDGSGTPLLGGEIGLLVNPDDIHEIAQSIVNVLTGKVRKELLDRAFLRQKVLSKFGIELFPKRVDELLLRFFNK